MAATVAKHIDRLIADKEVTAAAVLLLPRLTLLETLTPLLAHNRRTSSTLVPSSACRRMKAICCSPNRRSLI